MIKEFYSIDNFIQTIVPDLKSCLQKELSQGIQKSDLDTLAYYALVGNFKLFIVRNCSKDLDEYIDMEAIHASKETMKDVLLSTVSITLYISDVNGRKLNENNYLISFRNVIKNTKL